MWFRVLGLIIVSGLSFYLLRQDRKEWVLYLASGISSGYMALVFLEFMLDWGWASHLLARLGWPLMVVTWLGFLLYCIGVKRLWR